MFEYRVYEVVAADDGWKRDRAETELEGPLVARVHNEFWQAAEYSPLQQLPTWLMARSSAVSEVLQTR